MNNNEHLILIAAIEYERIKEQEFVDSVVFVISLVVGFVLLFMFN